MAWTVKNAEPKVLEQYEESGIPAILAKVLNNRGLQADTAYTILNEPVSMLLDPLGLVNVEKAVDEIIEAVENECEIWIMADYDADGMTSGFIMSDFLKTTTNNDVFPYYPNRTEGYGLSMDFAKMMVARRDETGKAIFVITVDNGVTCHEPVQFLKDNGINVVVTDHHQPKGTLPNCTIVNPQIVEDKSYKHLCGAGVAFKVVQAIEQLAQLPKDYTSKYYYAVMIGTIADMMPLTLENMAYIRLGLNQVNSKDCPYAIKEWMKFLGKSKLTPMDIGWEIGPRLNACGRMGESDLGGLLLSYKKDETPLQEVKDTLLEIEDLNQERKALTDEAKKEIKERFDNGDYHGHLACMFDASGYPAGITGIIAGKLLEETGRISLAYSGKEIVAGSARAPHGMNLQPIFEQELQKGNLLNYGGHEAAAGFSFHVDKMDELQASLNESLEALYSSIGTGTIEEQVLEVDGELALTDITKQNHEALQMFAYDKDVFTSPMFVLSNLTVNSTKRSNNKPNNICFTVQDASGKTMSIWAWGFGEQYKALGEPEKIHLIGQLDINFIDKRSITFKVAGLEAA